jgi:hypothetical protein
MFGAVSTKAHSTPSASACATISLIAAARALRSCGSACRAACARASRSLRIAVDQHAAPRWAVGMRGKSARQRTLAGPPLREAKTMTFMRATLIRVIWANLACRLIRP